MVSSADQGLAEQGRGFYCTGNLSTAVDFGSKKGGIEIVLKLRDVNKLRVLSMQLESDKKVQELIQKHGRQNLYKMLAEDYDIDIIAAGDIP